MPTGYFDYTFFFFLRTFPINVREAIRDQAGGAGWFSGQLSISC